MCLFLDTAVSLDFLTLATCSSALVMSDGERLLSDESLSEFEDEVGGDVLFVSVATNSFDDYCRFLRPSVCSLRVL